METEYSKYEPIFGSWKINKLIGEGSYGKVYEIEREDFGVTYKAALKAITIPRNRSDLEGILSEGMDEESASTYFRGFVEEMTREFALMDKLKGNSNVVNYEDHLVIEHQDEIGWDILIRMELLTPLNGYLKTKDLAQKDVAGLGIDLCRALELCDTYNIIHRDIKPENIFVSDLGVFKLGDFGIARVAEKTTGASTKIGTNSYMAPEIMRGENYDERVDLYSLGLVLYRLMNRNRLPFLPPAPAPITYSQREEANAKRLQGLPFPEPMDADRDLAQIILKATSFDPDQRYQHASEMRRDLEKYMGIRWDIDPEKQSVIPEITPAPVPITDQDPEEEKTVPLQRAAVSESEKTVAVSRTDNLSGRKKLVISIKNLILIICVALSLVGIAFIITSINTHKARTYTNENLGIEFTLPEGWKFVNESDDTVLMSASGQGSKVFIKKSSYRTQNDLSADFSNYYSETYGSSGYFVLERFLGKDITSWECRFLDDGVVKYNIIIPLEKDDGLYYIAIGFSEANSSLKDIMLSSFSSIY